MNPLVGLAVSLMPELLKLFAGNPTNGLQGRVEDVVKQITGTTTAEDAKAKLKDSPDVVLALQTRLAEIAVETHRADLQAAAASDQADLTFNTMQADDTHDARETLKDLIKLSDPTAYTPSAISYLIVLGFFLVLLLAIRGTLNGLAAEPLQIVNLLVGCLTASFATVLNFWLGSSLGSRRKDAAVAQSDAVRQIGQLNAPGGPDFAVVSGAGPGDDASAPRGKPAPEDGVGQRAGAGAAIRQEGRGRPSEPVGGAQARPGGRSSAFRPEQHSGGKALLARPDEAAHGRPRVVRNGVWQAARVRRPQVPGAAQRRRVSTSASTSTRRGTTRSWRARTGAS